MPRRIALTRGVSPAFARCELTHLAREPIDVARAGAQHAGYTALLASIGCEVMALPPDDTSPDCVFVEDVAIVLPEIAVLARPGAPSRRGEVPPVARALARFRDLRRIDPPDTLDGGDVLRIDHDVLVGLSARTTAGAVAQLECLLHPLGYRVRGVAVRGCLHLKTAATQVAPGTVLLNPAWADATAFQGFRVLEVDPSEPMAANALLVGGDLIYPDTFPRTRATLESAGVTVRPLDVSEIAKAEGGVTCCSIVFEA